MLPGDYIAFSPGWESNFHCLRSGREEDVSIVYMLDREFGSFRPYGDGFPFVDMLLESVEIWPKFRAGFG